ncbi:hypothetical protein HanPSC8_Chr16g0706061 [Helianthus annuus]|nr:hypothetical protein HanPSC8_Chr16g0706061 [Helianthus annuus]
MLKYWVIFQHRMLSPLSVPLAGTELEFPKYPCIPIKQTNSVIKE